MAVRLSSDLNETLPFLFMATPFFIDALFSLLAIYSAIIMDFSENLKGQLLEGSTTEERKFLPILLERFERYIYTKTDDEFMPELCNESFKNNAFKLEGRHFTLQLTSVLLIFAEIYCSILSAVHSNLAPVFSVFVTIYALTALFSFFGLRNAKAVAMSQSYIVSLKLAAVALGYLFESFRNGGFTYEISFIAMTALLIFDALLGYAMLVTRDDYSTEIKNYQVMGSKTMSFAFDNWKSHQFRSI